MEMNICWYIYGFILRDHITWKEVRKTDSKENSTRISQQKKKIPEKNAQVLQL